MTDAERDRQEADILLAERRAKAELARHNEHCGALLKPLREFPDVRPNELFVRDGKLWDARNAKHLQIPSEETLLEAFRERQAAAEALKDIQQRLAAITGA